MGYRIQNRRDTAARWAEMNPILLEGEIGLVTDNANQYKVGDGIHAWNDLPLRGFTGTISQELGEDENAVVSQKVVTEKLVEADGKLAKLGSEVNNLCKVGEKSKFINFDNGLVTEAYDDNFCISNYVNLDGINKIRYKIRGSHSGRCLIAAYDANKNYIQNNSIAPDVDYGTKEGIWEKGDNTVFVRFNFQVEKESFHLAFVESPFFEVDVKKIVKEVVEPIAENTNNKVEDLSNQINGNYTKGKYLDSTGAEVADDKWGYSDYIPYSGGKVTWRWDDTFLPVAGPQIIMYNSNLTVVDYWGAAGANAANDGRVFTPAEGTAFIRASFQLGSDAKVKIDGNVVWTPQIPMASEKYVDDIIETSAQKYTSIRLDTSILKQGLLNATNGFPEFTSGDYPNYRFCETFFRVTAGGKLVTNARCTGSQAAIIYYNTKKERIASQANTSTDLTEFIIPEGAHYVRLCTERYNITNGIDAFLKSLVGSLEKMQIEQLEDKVKQLEDKQGASPIKFFNPNKEVWIADEIAQDYTPNQPKLEYKHNGNVSSQDRFLVWGFDDLRDSDTSLIIPLFNKYGAKGTFNKIFQNTTPTDAEKAKMNTLLMGKHELGDHTWNHLMFPFIDALWNGQDPANPEGNQVPYPTNNDMRADVGNGNNALGVNILYSVVGSGSYFPQINTRWKDLTDAECQQIREWFSVMKDTSTDIIALLDELSNTYLGTTGSSVGSWDDAKGCYTGGIFTGCKTSANHEIWERYILVTNLYLKKQFGVNFDMKTWSKPGSKMSACFYTKDGKKYYDANHTILANNLARFPSSLIKNNDGTPLMRSLTDVLSAFGYTNTNDAEDPALRDGQIKPCMSIQFILNAKDVRPNALIYPNTRNKFMDYASIASEYTKGTDLIGNEPYEVQMYSDTNSSFYKAIEGWRHATANGIIVGQITDSQDTWSERVIIEGLLRYAKSAGIKLITLAEAYDVCFNNRVMGGNLISNPFLRNTAKEFMPTATNVPTNPDGYIGNCFVTNTDGEPTLNTNNNTIYEQFGVVAGRYNYSADVMGEGTIIIKAIRNNTPYNDRTSADVIATINISNGAFEKTEKNFNLPYNDLTEYEQLCAGYGDKVIGVRFEYSSGLKVKNISLKK